MSCCSGGVQDFNDDDNFGEGAPFDDDDGGDMDVDALAEAAAEGAYTGVHGAWQPTDQVRWCFAAFYCLSSIIIWRSFLQSQCPQEQDHQNAEPFST